MVLISDKSEISSTGREHLELECHLKVKKNQQLGSSNIIPTCCMNDHDHPAHRTSSEPLVDVSASSYFIWLFSFALAGTYFKTLVSDFNLRSFAVLSPNMTGFWPLPIAYSHKQGLRGSNVLPYLRKNFETMRTFAISENISQPKSSSDFYNSIFSPWGIISSLQNGFMSV